MIAFAIVMVPFAQARHHDHGPSKDMRNAYDIMNLIGMGVGILKDLTGPTYVVNPTPAIPVVTPAPTVIPTVPSYVVANPPVVTQPYVVPAYNPYYPTTRFYTPPPPPPRYYHRGGHHRGNNGHHGGGRPGGGHRGGRR